MSEHWSTDYDITVLGKFWVIVLERASGIGMDGQLEPTGHTHEMDTMAFSWEEFS